ncbi:hypothetical protein AB0B25_04300 [Nocardia sp. NPDC049190]|uniref:hypothetical protein n=1 Tax=Nocardia sp. NPDC049190 TaxID=3155650 RepID=UPI0033D2D397
MGTETAARLTHELVTLEQPRQVIHAAGRWLALNLADCGFDTWLKSSTSLQRRAGTRVEQISIQPSKFNRTGEYIGTSNITLLVYDNGLRHTDVNLLRPNHIATDNRWICRTTFAGALDYGRHYEINLTTPQQRISQLEDFARKVHEVAVPWFAYTRDPRNVGDLPDGFLDSCLPDIVDWLLGVDAQQAARTLIGRWLALDTVRDHRPPHLRPPAWRTTAFEKGQDIAAAGGYPSTDQEWLGWVAYQWLGMPSLLDPM